MNRQKKKDETGESAVLGFCPYCKILSPTLTVEKKRIGSRFTISCICRESNGRKISSRNREKAIKEWRKINVD